MIQHIVAMAISNEPRKSPPQILVQYGNPQNRPSCWRSITTNVKVSCAMATADAICGCHERLHRNVTDAEQKMGFTGILLPTGRYGFDILKTIFFGKDVSHGNFWGTVSMFNFSSQYCRDDLVEHCITQVCIQTFCEA